MKKALYRCDAILENLHFRKGSEMFAFTPAYEPNTTFRFTVDELTAGIDRRIERHQRTKRVSSLHPHETLNYLHTLKIRLKLAAKRLESQSGNDDLEWDLLTGDDKNSLAHFVMYLLECDCGSVSCPECQSEYPAKLLTSYTFRAWDTAGIDIYCPQDHGLFAVTTRILEFTDNMDYYERWKRDKDTD
jgi:hypothetical protein